MINLARNYVRLNEFPEWFVVEPNWLYRVSGGTAPARLRLGSELMQGRAFHRRRLAHRAARSAALRHAVDQAVGGHSTGHHAAAGLFVMVDGREDRRVRYGSRKRFT